MYYMNRNSKKNVENPNIVVEESKDPPVLFSHPDFAEQILAVGEVLISGSYYTGMTKWDTSYRGDAPKELSRL